MTITSDIWGQTVQGFHDSKDGGRDGAFFGRWNAKSGQLLEGAFTVQCKFTSKPDRVLKASDIKTEVSKARRLAAKGLADNYILFTNARLTGVVDEAIQKELLGISGIKAVVIFGRDRICQLIRERPRLRMLVPRVYGLGDLGQILDARGYDQAKELLSALGDDLGKFMITDAYKRAAKALTEHGFVLLLGEPACGKSTIAAALAVGAIDEWGCFALRVRDADGFERASNPYEPKQFFWVDDAFGPTQFDYHSTIRWNGVFPHMEAAIRRGARIVFTSRDYIYRSARRYLKESSLPVLNASQVVINVQDLSPDERDQILYNHVRLGTQPKAFRKEIKPYLSTVAKHKGFTPEIARRLGNPLFTKKLLLSKLSLLDFVEHPTELLEEIIRTIDPTSYAAIALVFMRGGALKSPVSLSADEMTALTAIGGIESDVRNALNSLDGSLLIQVQEGDEFFWRFKHPTIRDAFAALISDNRELLDIYLAGTPIPQMFREVSCGNMGIDGVKVIVPGDRFPAVIARIKQYLPGHSQNRDAVNRFLSYRADARFLSLFLSEMPNYLHSLNVHSYFYAVSDVGVICTLNKHRLLPEDERKRHIETICELAIAVPDAGFLNPDIRALFLDSEYRELIEKIRNDVVFNIDTYIGDLRTNHTSDVDPQEHFSELIDALSGLKKVFHQDDGAMDAIRNGLDEIDQAISSLEYSPNRQPWDSFYSSRSPEPSGTGRSIFDDVDD